ncbi:unnamed protein product [Blepharisma stoltei]|uniref:Uncharacterized protein n=1 Tax=Blepharisma stoltei TaxID=1481888 RepID=A0AAU9JYE8_9CILI|nr:unnamed protein product [Blepharisma stoltei]
MVGFMEWLFFIIGIGMIIKVLLNFCHSLTILFAKTDFSEYGYNSWALVTGASDGLGLAISEFLASQGFNIILIGRNQEKLTKVSGQLKEKYPIQIKIIVKDFSVSSANPQTFFLDIKEQTKNLDVSILVNNVGSGAGANCFASLAEERVLWANAINLWPAVFLTKLYLPDMTLRKNRSAVINITSSLALVKLPKCSVYCASKGFMHSFSMIVAEEAKYLSSKNKGRLDVMSVLPSCIDTQMIKMREIKPLLVNPYDCAFWICKSIGSVSYTGGHWKHEYFYLLWTLFGSFSFQLINIFARLLKNKSFY